MRRREFFKSLAAAGAVLFGGKAVAQEMGGGHGPEMKHDMHEPIGWTDSSIKISPPPRLTGVRMGTVYAPDIEPLGYEMDKGVKVFTLIAQPVVSYIIEGEPPEGSLWDKIHKAKGIMPGMHLPKKVRLWGFNGSVPGPVIEANEGDEVRIIIKNELPEGTSIHWHGLEVPNEMDGVGGVTQPPIPTGGTFVYEFKLYQHGTFMYHSSFNEKKQVGMGLSGMFVIHPKKARKIDKDFAILLQEWKFLAGSEYPDVTSTDPNWFTFNGKSAPGTEILRASEGERVRIRFANLSNLHSHPIHIHGHTWKVVGTEGGPVPEAARWPGNTVDVPPGAVRDVEFEAWNPGLWHMHCHKLHHIVNGHADAPMGVMPMGGMSTFLEVAPEGKRPWRHYSEGKGE